MNKKLLKLLLVMSLCLSISGCNEDDEDFDWGSFTVCGNFEEYFGGFEERRTYTHSQDGAVMYGKCTTFSCTDSVITAQCEGLADSTPTETCNGVDYTAKGIEGAVDLTIDASGFFVEGTEVDGETEYTIGGEIITNISDFKLNFSLSATNYSVECSGKIIFDDFEDKALTCENADISCTTSDGTTDETHNCEEIKTLYEELSSSKLCAATIPTGEPRTDLLELGLLKIEELIQAKKD